MEPLGQVNRMACFSCRCIFDVRIIVDIEEVFSSDKDANFDADRAVRGASPPNLLPADCSRVDGAREDG
jgi:hypothetical protein